MENRNRVFTRLAAVFMLVLLSLPARTYPASLPARHELVLSRGWYVSSSEHLAQGGAYIASPACPLKGWYPAVVPSTIMSTLVANNVYTDVFVGDNLKRVPAKLFERSWWYRTEVAVPKDAAGKTIRLEFNGIVYRANIWLNGQLLASADTIKGPFRRFSLDVSRALLPGKKAVLAVEVIPARAGEPSIGFADWNPRPPDNNLGLWREVKLTFAGALSIEAPYVQSTLDMKSPISARLRVSADIINNTNAAVTGTLTGAIGNITFSTIISMEPGGKKTVTFGPEDYPQLTMAEPKLWWPHAYGAQHLSTLTLQISAGNTVSDACEKKFGIRSVADYVTDGGFKGYMVNGKKIQILGGGWTDNIFLQSDRNNLEAQIRYVRHMGLNTIRLEGFWGSTEDLYDLCDKYGILVMAGWSCQWENDEYIGKHVDEFGGIESPEDIAMIAQSWEDQIVWLRNHPSIFVWVYGSDRLPRVELEKRYVKTLRERDTTRPVLAATAEYTSAVSGKTGVKMRGPYAYVPPVYWWSDKQKGGAFGFATEQGSGAQVPPVESMLKMLPKAHRWPADSVWNYHCATGTFNNMKDFNVSMSTRLGAPGGLHEYCTKAQFINYENARAMYEAVEANKYVSTGSIHWMLNAAWPKLWWQLYDHYLMPNAAFYGIKKAREPIHIAYDYAEHAIVAVNNTLDTCGSVTATVRILNFDLTEKYATTVLVALAPDETKRILRLPVPADLSNTYFLDLKLVRDGKTTATNFYCLSSTADVLDTAKATWYMTPAKRSADLSALNTLQKVRLDVRHAFTTADDRERITVELANTTKMLALQIELSVTKGNNGGSILPIFWDDNYFSMLPGEKRTVRGYFSKVDAAGKQPVLHVSGWNVK